MVENYAILADNPNPKSSSGRTHQTLHIPGNTCKPTSTSRDFIPLIVSIMANLQHPISQKLAVTESLPLKAMHRPLQPC